MDEAAKGCVIAGVVIFFVGICGFFFVITYFVVIGMQALAEASREFPTAVAQSMQILMFLLTCIIELVKYSLTPFMPVIQAITPLRK